MKAIILKGFGGAENLAIEELPIPEMSENEVIVNVKAIGINPIDIKTRKGKGLAGALKDFNPIILGWDISGIIAHTGTKVNLLHKGDEVFGMINFPGHGKAYSEYVAVPENQLALKPSNITHEEAAAASLAALTAWQILKYNAGIKKGDKVLIHSAAGGVGHYAVQLAKHLGAWVAGTASGKNRDFVLNMGADRHIDYENENFEELLHDIDFVLDTIGGGYSDRSFKVLKPGGTIICIPSGTSEDITEKAAGKGLKGYHFRVQSDGSHMKEIADLLEKGIVKSCISGIFKFEEIQAAHLQIETGRTRGKIIVAPG
ncbi:MAG: NADP-dependent oxidoreductase [Bacteroidales bacterium]|nr:NADP-dependent oxidoreductase [Bacteroidales bacterium]